MAELNYAEFDNPRLAKIYDSFNSLTDDKTFWLKKVKELGVQSIVDLGCGTGLLTCELARLGYDVIGIEPAQPMLDVAQQKPYSDKVTWSLGSAERLAGIETDLVIMTSHVAQFFLDDKAWITALRQINESLKEGGYILFDSKNPLSKPWNGWGKETTSRKKSTPEGDVEFWIDSPIVNGNQVEYDLHYLFLADQTELISKNKLIYRTKEELVASLEDSGLVVEKVFGNWDNGEFEKDDAEMVFLAKKAGR